MRNNDWLRWKESNRRQQIASDCAEDVLRAARIRSKPIDPFALADFEKPWIRVTGDDYRSAFDGRIEYDQPTNRFVIFYNTKYDAGYTFGTHHPRTRFSLAHELGHFHLETHRALLIGGKPPHGSFSEFVTDSMIEHEADAFAASLLMPHKPLRSALLSEGFSTEGIKQIAAQFETSLLSTAIRCVQLSDLPCAVTAIKDARIAWQIPSESLIKSGCFPSSKHPPRSKTAQRQWDSFLAGSDVSDCYEAELSDWFQGYRIKRLQGIYATEHYLPVPISETLVVLLTIDEEDLYGE